jgi:hypothetical protein
MRSPGVALIWQQWRNSRLATAAILAYVLVLAAAAHAPGAMGWRVTLFTSASPLALGFLFLLATYTFPGADVLTRHSGFPTWMLTLPTPTWRLVFWPMLHGALAAALCWILPAALILRPLGLPVPLDWPAALLAALLACLQALLWTPFGLPYLRVVVTLVLIPTLSTLAVNAAAGSVSPTVLTVACLGLTGIAYVAAVAGLARARRGETPAWEWPARPSRSPLHRRASSVERRASSAFATALSAQLWYEWRSGGAALPLVLGVVCGLLSLPLLWVRELTPLGAPAGSSLADIEVNLWLRLQQAMLFAPPLLAAVIGCGRRNYDARRGDLTIHPFLATRPLSSHEFVLARWKSAARSTLASWIVMLLFVTGRLLAPASKDDTTAPLLWLLVRGCPWQTFVTLGLILAVLMLWTWKSQVQGLFADVSGRPWCVYGIPLVVHSLLLAAWCAGLQGSIALQGPQTGPGGVPSWLLWLLAGAVAAKAVAATSTWIAVRRRDLAPLPLLLRLGATWILAALGLIGVLSWIAAEGAPSSPLAELATRIYLPICSDAMPAAWHSPGTLAALTALFLPFSRLIAAVVTLAANRHR